MVCVNLLVAKVGCSHTTVSKLQVTNAINTMINNSNQVINNIVNKTINDVSTELVNNVSSSINVDTNSYNNLDLSDVILNGGTFNVNQQAIVDAQSIAMNNIASSQQSMDQLTSSLMNALQNKAQTDSQLQTAMTQLNKINDITKDAGGPEHVVDSVMNSLNSVASGESSSENDKIFNSIMNINTNTQNLTQNTIDNIVKNSVSGKITSNTFGSVKIGSSAGNTATIRSVTVNGTPVNINQNATLKNFTKAITDLKIGTGISNQILNTSSVEEMTDELNKQAETLKSTNDTTDVTLKDQESGLTDLLKSLNPLTFLSSLGNKVVIVIIVIVVVIAGLLFLFFGLPLVMKMFKKSPLPAQVPAPNAPNAPHTP